MITKLPASDLPGSNGHPALASTHFFNSIKAARRRQQCLVNSHATRSMYEYVHDCAIKAGPPRKCNLPLAVKAHERAEQLKKFVADVRAGELAEAKDHAFKLMAVLKNTN